MNKREELAKEIMTEYEKDGEPVTFEEALEIADMEISSKENFKHCEQSVKPRKKMEKERKVDNKKGALLEEIKLLLEVHGAEVTFQLTETEVDFILDEEVYTVKLTRHGEKWQRKVK